MERLPARGGPNEDERAALARLATRYAPMLERMARSFTRYGVDADDLIQEAWVALLTLARRVGNGIGAEQFAGQARFAVSVGLTRFVLDAYGPVRVRRCRLRALATLLGRQEWSATSASLPQPTPSREEELLHAEARALRQRELERALSSLGAEERAVIEALHLDDDPPELPVLARRLGIAERQVRLLEARALGRMIGTTDAHDPDARVLVGGRRVRLHERPRPAKRRRMQPAMSVDSHSRSEWAPQ